MLISKKRVVREIDNLLAIQKDCLDDEYMKGLYNGMALTKANILKEKPVFHDQLKD